MEWEDFISPLGDPPSPLDYSYAPWGITEPPSPSTIYVPSRLEQWISSSASRIDPTSPSINSLGQLEKLSIDDFAYKPCENDFGPIQQSRKDIAVFRCGCWRLDRSKWRDFSENGPTNVTWDGKPAAYRWARSDDIEGFEGRYADIMDLNYSIYDKNCGT